jgi:hypothetical protein
MLNEPPLPQFDRAAPMRHGFSTKSRMPAESSIWHTAPSNPTSRGAIFSERMYTPPHDRGATPEAVADTYSQNPLVLAWGLGISFFHGQEDEFHSVCDDPSRRRAFPNVRPLTNPSMLSRAWYDHVRPPNSLGCMYIAPPRPFTGWTQPEYSMPANSAHTGGVTMALCDGATTRVADGIDVHVWRAVGTRNGGESHEPF